MTGFKLAGLLRLRSLQEQMAAVELAEANNTANRIRDHKVRVRSQLAGVEPGTVSARNLAALAMSRAAAQSMLAELTLMHETAAADARTAQEAHQHAKANARAIEKLRDRYTATTAAADLRDEQAALDEIAVTGWRRNEEER